MYWESVFYMMARLGGECDFPMFLSLQMMLFCAPSKLQNGLSFFSFLYNFGRFARPQTPHFSALEPLKLHLCTLVPMPGTPFSHTPKHHLGCPILPFGVSHFTFWGIFSAHLPTPHRFDIFVFRNESMCVIFASWEFDILLWT